MNGGVNIYLGKETYLPEDREELLGRMDQMIDSITEQYIFLRRHSRQTV